MNKKTMYILLFIILIIFLILYFYINKNINKNMIYNGEIIDDGGSVFSGEKLYELNSTGGVIKKDNILGL